MELLFKLTRIRIAQISQVIAKLIILNIYPKIENIAGLKLILTILIGPPSVAFLSDFVIEFAIIIESNFPVDRSVELKGSDTALIYVYTTKNLKIDKFRNETRFRITKSERKTASSIGV